MLDEMKIEEISKVIMDNQSEAKELFSKTPEEALKFMSEKGYDFTIEEIKEYGEMIAKMAKEQPNGELSVDDLDNVAGGKGGNVAAVVGIALFVGVYFGW